MEKLVYDVCAAMAGIFFVAVLIYTIIYAFGGLK